MDYEYGTWINPYNGKEKYIRKSIEHHKTGHCWLFSGIETDNTCGNCNGAKCDRCRDMWIIHKYGEPKPHIDDCWGYDYNEEVVLSERKIYNEAVAREIYEAL